MKFFWKKNPKMKYLFFQKSFRKMEEWIPATMDPSRRMSGKERPFATLISFEILFSDKNFAKFFFMSILKKNFFEKSFMIFKRQIQSKSSSRLWGNFLKIQTLALLKKNSSCHIFYSINSKENSAKSLTRNFVKNSIGWDADKKNGIKI